MPSEGKTTRSLLLKGTRSIARRPDRMKMKDSVLIFLALLLVRTSLAGEKPTEIKAPVSAVKVCLNAAQITHLQKVKVRTGNNKYAFMGLATTIGDRNIALRNIGSGELLTLRLVKLSDTTNIFSLPEDLQEIIRKNKDSILNLERKIEKIKFEIDALQLEKRMLLDNTDVIKGGKALADLKMTSDYYRDRYTALNMEMTGKQKSLRDLKRDKIRALKSAFDVGNSEEDAVSISVILAEIRNAGAEYSADMELVYLAGGAGWIPVYDVISADKGPLKINYRAKILNNTGLDWNNMNITISTADPYEYYSAPDLAPFVVTRYSYQRTFTKEEYENGDADEYGDEQQTRQQRRADLIKNQEEEIDIPDREISFQIAKKYDFNAGSTPYFVDVRTHDLVPDYLYRCAPKKEEQVYLVARIKDWEKLDLIDGEASIYYNGIFLGKSYIRPGSIEDHLELPLGVVSNIFVKHKLVSESSGKKTFGGGITASCNYEIKLKNGSGDKIAVEVIDQVPVSEESSVKTEGVEFTEGGDKDVNTGKIVWKLDLAADTEKTLFLKYTVSYPRGYRFGGMYKKRAIRAKF